MSYDYSSRYIGDSGQEYLRYQSNFDSVARIKAETFSRFIEPSDVVLDFGCGPGLVLDHLNCSRRIGVEINADVRANARSRGLECFPDLRDVEANVADVVISNHALEHVLYPIDALREIRRVLKRPGTMIVCVPMDDWRTQRAYKASDIDHHLYSWTPQLFGNCLSEAGFSFNSDAIHVLTHALPPYSHLLYRVLPRRLFHGVCMIFAVLKRRRQLIAVVRVT